MKKVTPSHSPVWFITGASKGLGLALSETLLRKGYRVVATTRNLRDLTRTLGEASDQFLPVQMDLADEKSVASATRSALAHFGAVDVVVNNAGYGQFGTVEEVSDEEARENFDVNVFGLLNVIRATAPHFRERRKGHYFNISSIGGFVGGYPGVGIYCATKFAVAGLSEGLHADLAPLGVNTTLVYPGYFRTQFLDRGSMVQPKNPIADYANGREVVAAHADTINGNQPGDPVKAAEAMIAVAEMAEPPFHLFLGRDAVGLAETKLTEVRTELEAHRKLSESTDRVDE